MKYSVKRGLRNEDGSGVLVGLTKISSVIGFKIVDQEVIPVDGELYYRGININDLVKDLKRKVGMVFQRYRIYCYLGNYPLKKS